MAKRGARVPRALAEEEKNEDAPVQKKSLLDEKAEMIRRGIVVEDQPDVAVVDEKTLEDLSQKKALLSVQVGFVVAVCD